MAKRRLSSIRSARFFTRKSKRVLPSEAMLIVCEGETERRYFKTLCHCLKLTSTEIHVCDNGKDSAPINLVRKAELLNSINDGYDHIYCVFDRDLHESFDRARQKIKGLSNRLKKPLPIKEAVSIPSFEFWILLHYEQTDRSFSNSDEVKRHIENYKYIKNYQKTDESLCQQLISKLDDALINACWLEGRGHNHNQNPMTSVHQLVKKIQQLSKIN